MPAKTKAPVEPVPQEASPLRINVIGQERMRYRITGTKPLALNKFSEKAKQMMLDKQKGKRATAREHKGEPLAEMEKATYRLPDGRPGIPAVSIKAAMVGAARYYHDLTLVGLKTAIRVDGGKGPDDLLAILADEPEPWEKSVRVGTGTADIRYRPRWAEWAIEFDVTYADTLHQDTITALLVTAGQFGGLGEWRPSAPKSLTGNMGLFDVDILVPE